jgi:hypothetical protein
MKNLINIKRKDNITFGILFFIFFLIIGLYPLKSDEVIRVWSVVLSLVLLIITIIKPNLFTFLNKFWIKFGVLLGKIISPIVMGLKRGATSYWINREDKVQSMKKQF